MNWTFLYVALLYFSSVLLIRRYLRMPWLAAAIFFLLVWVFLFAGLTLNSTLLPTDHILAMYPWRPFYGVEHAHNPQLNDVMIQMVPWAHQVRESWKRGEAPLWNPAAGMGYPLLANGQSAALSPLRLISLPLGLAQSFACEAALKLLAAMTFAFLYMAHRGRSAIAAVATAVSFGFCGFMTLWLYWNHSSVVAFLPALFLAIDLIVEKPTLHRAAFAAFVFATLLLNGHPESAAHAAVAGGVYAFYRIVPMRFGGIRPALLMAGSVAVGILLALPFLLPFLEVLPFTQRYQLVGRHSLFLPLDPRHLVPFVVPQFYGTERDRTLWGPGNTDELSGYSGIFAIISWLAVLLWRRRHLSWRSVTTFHLIAAPLFLVTALGWPPLAPLLRVLPPFSMAANGRLRFVASWFFAVLVGEAIHCLLTRSRRTPLLAGCIAAAVFVVLPFVLNRFPSDDALVNSAKAAVPGLIVVVVVCAVGLTRNSEPGTRNLRTAAIIAAIVFDLWSLGRPWYTPFPLQTVRPETPLLSELRQRISSCSSPCRIGGIYATFFPNTAAMFGFEDIRAHDPMALGRPLGALRVHTGYTSDEYFGLLTDVRSPFLNFINMKYLVVAPHEQHQSARLVEVYRGVDGAILENREVLPRFFAATEVMVEPDDTRRMDRLANGDAWSRSVVVKHPPGSGSHDALVKVLSAQPRRFRLFIDAPHGAFVASSQPLVSGWNIRSGDRSLTPVAVNELFIGFAVPPGRHIVELAYQPLSFRIGAFISIVTLVGLVVAMALRRRLGTRDSGPWTIGSIAPE